MKRMKPGGLACCSNDIYPERRRHVAVQATCGQPHLTGRDHTVPDAHNPADREILFTLETNDELAIWEGAKLTKAQATAETGIANVQTTALERTLHR